MVSSHSVISWIRHWLDNIIISIDFRTCTFNGMMSQSNASKDVYWLKKYLPIRIVQPKQRCAKWPTGHVPSPTQIVCKAVEILDKYWSPNAMGYKLVLTKEKNAKNYTFHHGQWICCSSLSIKWRVSVNYRWG